MNENPYASPQFLAEPPLAPAMQANGYRYKPLVKLLHWNWQLATIVLTCSTLIFAYNFALVFTPIGTIDVTTSNALATIDQLMSIARGFFFIPAIAWNICFVMATYRVAANTHALAEAPPGCTPGYAVGSYFIPFLNFVRPYQVMRKLYDACTIPASWLLICWWLSHLGSGILGGISYRLWSLYSSEPYSPTIAEGYAQAATIVDFIQLLCCIALAILSHRVLSELAARQNILASLTPSSTEWSPASLST